MKNINGYTLSRKWFDFCFENPDKVNPTHSAIYLLCVDRWNRFGQKEKFGLPADFVMDGLGIKSRKTFYKTFKELVEWGFIIIVQKAINQNTANIITISACVNNTPADTPTTTPALDLANTLADTPAGEHNRTSKPLNKGTIKQKEKLFFENEQLNKSFLLFVEHRKQMKKKMTENAIDLTVKKINKWLKIYSVDNVIIFIEEAIERGRQTIREKTNSNSLPKQNNVFKQV